MIGYLAGTPISGTIDVVINEPFESSELQLAFKGVERTHFVIGDLDPVIHHREVREIIQIRETVKEFTASTILQPGQYTFPFQIMIPDWLPETCVFKLDNKKFFVEYTIRAQFLPTNKEQFAHDIRFPNKFKDISIFRGSRKVYVYHPP